MYKWNNIVCNYFQVLFLKFSIILSVFISSFVCIKVLNSIPWYVFTRLFNHSFIEGCLNWFQILVIINKCAINIYDLFFVNLSFHLPGINVQWLDHMSYMFRFLKTCQTAFHSGYTVFHSHMQYKNDPIPLHIGQHLVSLIFF